MEGRGLKLSFRSGRDLFISLHEEDAVGAEAAILERSPAITGASGEGCRPDGPDWRECLIGAAGAHLSRARPTGTGASQSVGRLSEGPSADLLDQQPVTRSQLGRGQLRQRRRPCQQDLIAWPSSVRSSDLAHWLKIFASFSVRMLSCTRTDGTLDGDGTRDGNGTRDGAG